MVAKTKEELIRLLETHYYVWFNGLRYRKVSDTQVEVGNFYPNDTGKGLSFSSNLADISSLFSTRQGLNNFFCSRRTYSLFF